jgi:autotransporter-associated beta strand protein
MTFTGTGTTSIIGPSTFSGQINVSGGTLILNNANQTIASLQGNGALTLNGYTLKIAAHTGAQTANQIGTLTLSGVTGNWTSKLDLTNDSLVVHGGDLGTVTNQVQQGFAGGTWQGSFGITSSTAAADATHLTALGAIINDANGAFSGTPLYGSGGSLASNFEGTFPLDGDVLIKYTYYGDTDLNGQVDGSDYSRIDSTYVDEGFTNGIPSTQISGWFNGDFNYDSVVDGSDYTLIDNTFNSQGARIAAQPATTTDLIAGSSSAVPEPTTLGVLGICALGILGRRRRRGP